GSLSWRGSSECRPACCIRCAWRVGGVRSNCLDSTSHATPVNAACAPLPASRAPHHLPDGAIGGPVGEVGATANAYRLCRRLVDESLRFLRLLLDVIGCLHYALVPI